MLQAVAGSASLGDNILDTPQVNSSLVSCCGSIDSLPTSIITEVGKVLLRDTDPSHRLYLVLQLYIDISGHEANDRVVTAAGYIASEPEWEIFRHEWKAVLDRTGTDAPFHATDLFAGNNDFFHLKEDPARRHDLARRFAVVAHKYLRAPISYSLDLDHFADLGGAFRRLKTPHDRMRAAMLVSGQLCAKIARKHIRLTERALVFFEDGAGVGEVIAYLEGLQKLGEGTLQAYEGFAKVKKKEYAAQAADFFAYESWLEAKAKLENSERNWHDVTRPSLQILLTGSVQSPFQPTTTKGDMLYVSKEHVMTSLPKLRAFLDANPEYRKPPFWETWRSQLRDARKAVYWNAKRRAKRFWYGTLGMRWP